MVPTFAAAMVEPTPGGSPARSAFPSPTVATHRPDSPSPVFRSTSTYPSSEALVRSPTASGRPAAARRSRSSSRGSVSGHSSAFTTWCQATASARRRPPPTTAQLSTACGSAKRATSQRPSRTTRTLI